MLLSIIIAVRLEKNSWIPIGDNVVLMLGSPFDTGRFSTISCSDVYSYESYVYTMLMLATKSHMHMDS